MTPELLGFVADEMGLSPSATALRLRLRDRHAQAAVDRVMAWEETGIRFEKTRTPDLTIADRERMWGKPKPGVKRKKATPSTQKAGKILYQPKLEY